MSEGFCCFLLLRLVKRYALAFAFFPVEIKGFPSTIPDQKMYITLHLLSCSFFFTI